MGNGPKAEAPHGRYTRAELRYLRAQQPVQWLIATETIRRPDAPARSRLNRTSRDEESEGEHTNSGTGTTGDKAETDHLNAIRRQLFPHTVTSQQLKLKQKTNKMHHKTSPQAREKAPPSPIMG